jgi:hypothetical protein
MNLQQPAILIPSCDKYEDAWIPFFYSFEHYWSDCPYDTYLLTNFKDSPREKTTTIKVGKDLDYASNLIHAVNQIPNDYIIIWLEDLFLCSAPSQEFHKMINSAISQNVGYLRLWKKEEGLGDVIDEYFHTIPKGLRFRLSLRPALWKKETLLKLLNPGESPHETEEIGTKRSFKIDDLFYGLRKNQPTKISCMNGIYRGKYIPSALVKLEKMGFDTSILTRPKMSKRWQSIQRILVIPMDKVYYKLRRAIINVISKGQS